MQPLVYTLEQALSYKVTIIDVDGYIIGTSDPARLHQFHPSAYEILCGRLPLELMEEDGYQNLPENVRLGYGDKIIYNGECLGIIGLLGPPEERKKDIKTALFVLKLLLDLEQAQSELDLVTADKNALIARLLHGVNAQEVCIKKRATYYGISLHIPRYVIVAKIPATNLMIMPPLKSAAIVKKLSSAVKNHFCDGEDMIYESETGEVVILTGSKGLNTAAKREKVIEKALVSLQKELVSDMGFTPLIGVSRECSSYLNYTDAYQQALSAIEIGERTNHGSGVCYYEKLSLGRIVAGFPDKILPILKEGIIDRLMAAQEQELLHTLQVYFDNNTSVINTANELFIHRNTLQYRFKQIKQITGYDIRKVDDLVQLRLAVLQQQLFSN